MKLNEVLVTGTQLAVTGLTARTAYAFRVVAYDAAGNRAESALPVTTLPPASITGQARERPGFKYRSRKPYDISAFDRISEEEMTYAQPWFLPGKGFINFFTKYTKGRELYFETSPDGVTWSGDQKLAGLGGHYQVTSLKDKQNRHLLQLPSQWKHGPAYQSVLHADYRYGQDVDDS